MTEPDTRRIGPGTFLRSKLVWLLVALAAGGWWVLRDPEWTVVNNPPRPGPIVALGDSLTHGTGVAREQSYPAVLSELVGAPVLNAGIEGDTIADAAARLERDVLPLEPAIVIVLLGGNDWLRRFDLDHSFATLESLIRRIQHHGAMVVLVGVKGRSRFFGTNQRFREIARRTGAAYVPGILDDIHGNRRRMSDPLHPNAEGYRMMAERLAPALRTYIQKMPAPVAAR